MIRCLLACVAVLALAGAAWAQEDPGAPAVLEGLTLTDGGDIALYEAEGRVVLGLSPAAVGRFFL